MARFFVIGLDGATFRILDPLMNAGELPNLSRLKHEGSSGVLWSTIHPFSAQAWSSFMTGKNPGKHGLFDFIHHEEGSYRLKFVNASDRKAVSLWRILSIYGLQVGVMNVPLTYPPEEVNGFLIAGMDAPGKGSNFVYPPSLLAELEKQVGPYTIELSIRDYLRHGLVEKFLDDLRHMVRHQVRFVKYLTSQKSWDFFIFVCRATDQIQHFYWRFLDYAHPYHPKNVSLKLKNAIADIYKDIDKVIGEIEKEIGQDTYLLIMSDHGQGPDSNRAFYVNKWLRSKGFLRFKKENEKVSKSIFRQEKVSTFVEGLKKILPRRLKNFLLLRFPSLRDRVETMLSFSDIDFRRTLAYSEDVRGNIWINLKGRQPEGTVRPEEYHQLREKLIYLLEELRDPETGNRITDRVYRREDLYSGEFLSRAPDIIFTQPNDAYTYMLRRSRTDRNLNKWVETIPESGIGVWPTSSHTLDGIFFLKGNKVNRGKWINGVHIIDLAPTILYLMGLTIPDDMDGKVIQDAIDPAFFHSHPPKNISAGKEAGVSEALGYTEEEQARIQERLKDLGYIE
jgi:predicted AlkP superfamily phosphohydrolase/phosphomutase